jgi:hypothetical protein
MFGDIERGEGFRSSLVLQRIQNGFGFPDIRLLVGFVDAGQQRPAKDGIAKRVPPMASIK